MLLFGSKTSCQQARAEVRTHHPLARGGEQYLLDQVADVVVAIGDGGSAKSREAVGIVEGLHGRPPHVASTRVCATTGIIGAPVGMQVEEPAIVATGTPPAITRTAPAIHWPVTQGGDGTEASVHPATA